MRRTLLIGLMVAGLMGSGTAVAEPPEKPFKGSFTALDPPVPPIPDCPVHVAGVVEGRASHLGVFSGSTTTCGFNLQMVVNPPFVPGGS